jgi:hypothetical protein
MKRLILIVLAAGGLLGAAVLLSRTQTPRAVETMAGAPAETPRSAGFVLGEYGGRVAVYGAEADAPPREITSIWVHYLPSADRNALKKGISAANELALAALLEDLGS